MAQIGRPMMRQVLAAARHEVELVVEELGVVEAGVGELGAAAGAGVEAGVGVEPSVLAAGALLSAGLPSAGADSEPDSEAGSLLLAA